MEQTPLTNDTAGIYALTTFEYDKNGRIKKTIDPEHDPNNTQNPYNHTDTQTYDNEGNIHSKTDGEGNTTTYTYDPFGRLTQVTNAKGETTTFEYDPNGNMVGQTNGKQHKTVFKYNIANKVYERVDPNGEGNPAKTESYTYYSDGSLKGKTDRNGAVTTYGYDIHGNLVSQVTTQEGKQAVSISYTYDDNGNQLTITDATGVTQRKYDELNRVKEKTVPGIGASTFTYDLITSGNLLAELSRDPKQNQTTKIYDRAGRLKYVIDGGITTFTTAMPMLPP